MQLLAPASSAAHPTRPSLVGFTDAIARIQDARTSIATGHLGRANFELSTAAGSVSYGAMLLTTIDRTYDNVNRFMQASQDIGFALGHLGHLGEPIPEAARAEHVADANAVLAEAEQLLRELPVQ
jgi:hypothetical protein